MIIMNTIDHGERPPIEEFPCSAIQPKVGLAMTLSSGKLAKCSATAKPTFICVQEADKAVEAGTMVQVIRVHPTMEFETTCTEDFAAVNPGDKVTISADGMEVTATKTSGVATVQRFDDTAIGSKVYVRFI